MKPRSGLALLFLSVLAVLVPAGLLAGHDARHAVKAPKRARPNIVVVMTDDQTLENMRVMRNVKQLLGKQGATFDEAVVSYALCCPSRATFFTGQYAKNHRVLSNRLPYGGFKRFDHRTALPVWLRRGGYHTAHVGKYLNGLGVAKPRERPAGWDEWYGTVDPSTYRYWNYTLNENGWLVRYGDKMTDYQTDVLGRKAVRVIETHALRRKPLFLSVAFLAPHSGGPVTLDDPPRMLTPEPAPRHRDRFVFESLPAPPSYDEENVKDKPVRVRRRKLLEDYVVFAMTENYQQRLESLLSVDEAVRNIVNALQRTGELENTYIFFTSDNGFFHGEHRIANGKVLPYDPALRVPLVVRGPGIKPGLVLKQLVANIDLAPTIADIARVPPGRIVDGVSLIGLLNTGTWGVDRDILIESGPSRKLSQMFSGIRTARHQYVEYANGERELYDLVKDPYQLTNVAGEPEHETLLAELAQRLDALEACAGPTCRR
ncbi:MAG: sulfatase [Thermoleophilia bacterium]|nr:sulfatase [Thermoleophilia bacterium]